MVLWANRTQIDQAQLLRMETMPSHLKAPLSRKARTPPTRSNNKRLRKVNRATNSLSATMGSASKLSDPNISFRLRLPDLNGQDGKTPS
jgi:hypothetical protein